ARGGLLGFFRDLGLAVAGSSTGGAGKVAVIASGLFGTVNGSAIANAVTTGSITIPIMTRAGYQPAFAAGVEATASMGGQLIPPVMGAAAFIMAETLGVPYATIALSAAIPGVLYFATVGIVVGVVSLTGLGLKLATGIVGLAQGNLFVTLVLTMIAALVLGTGLPTSATYIITSIMAAPALVQLGVPKLVAHMFVFYF